MAVYRTSTRGNTAGLQVIDNGTNYLIKIGGTTLFGIRKSDFQILSIAAFDSDQIL